VIRILEPDPLDGTRRLLDDLGTVLGATVWVLSTREQQTGRGDRGEIGVDDLDPFDHAL